MHLELDLSRLHLGEVEDVVDEREQMVPRRDDVIEVLRLLLVHRADHLVLQHLREADDRVERRPQLVGHVGQELRLVLTRRLELGVEAPQLVVHPVDVGAQRAELVSIVDLHVAREVARRDRGEASVDRLDRPDHRPREDEPEQQREHDRPRRDADEQRAGAREGARVASDQLLNLCPRPMRQVRGVLVEVGRELFGIRSQRQHLLAQSCLVRDGGVLAPVAGDDLLHEQSRERLGLVLDPVQDLLIVRRRREQELIRGRVRPDPARPRRPRTGRRRASTSP